jgi:hypothetical protein
MDMQTENWIKSTLSNDEYSSDEELIEYFMTEGPMSKEEAEKWVAQRSFYMNNIVMDNGLVYNPNTRSLQAEAVIK